MDEIYYEVYQRESEKGFGLYEHWANKTGELGVSVYNIMMTGGIYASLIAWVISGIMLMIASNNSGGKLGDAKKKILITFIVSVSIFAALGVVTLIQYMGMNIQKLDVK